MNRKGSRPEADLNLAELGADALLDELTLRDPSFAEGSAIYDLVSKVSSLLRQMRSSAELTQAELADKLGMSQGRISQIESGLPDHAPNLEMIARIAHACGVVPQFGFDTSSSPGDEGTPREDGTHFAARVKAAIITQSEGSAVTRAKEVYGGSDSS